MNVVRFIYLLVAIFASANISAQYVTEIKSQNGEYWWGGVTALGDRMPYVKPIDEFNLLTQNNNNQVVPLLLSNKGRYIWGNYPFKFTASEEGVKINSDFETIEVIEAGSTLKEAYIQVCSKHFPPSGTIPEELFFSVPQYNTWIELMYNQNQKDILEYAKNILANDLPAGVLMIDDNWQNHYGNFEFKPGQFPDPKGMINELHRLGFKVMVWICPFVSADSPEFRELSRKGYLLKDKNNEVAILKWWNGYSACYDLTNPDAKKHLVSLLKIAQEKYGIDGYKLDAGDNGIYSQKELVSYKKDAIATDHTKAWAEIGLEFPFNEYRACWQMGGQPLVQRLGDKDYSWNAVQSLIPEMIAAGLLGYAYTCPDMIGGGQYKSFLNMESDKLDQTLIVRSAQIHALMPMMQFSVAPWRVLNTENFDIVKNMAHLHEQMGKYIVNCALKSAESGEPIVRHMEYDFPNQGFATCKDQFMLGETYMIAPVVTNENKRTVILPKGRWKDDLGKIHKGGRVMEINVPLSRLPYYERLK